MYLLRSQVTLRFASWELNLAGHTAGHKGFWLPLSDVLLTSSLLLPLIVRQDEHSDLQCQAQLPCVDFRTLGSSLLYAELRSRCERDRVESVASFHWDRFLGVQGALAAAFS